MNDEIPRRARLDKWVTAERLIQNAIDEVERMGASDRLTDAVVLLGQAREAVADFVDGIKRTAIPPSGESKP